MASESENTNLNKYIDFLKNRVLEEVPMPTIVDAILIVARENGCKVREFSGSFYIEKGEDPAAILHLNIDNPYKIPFHFESVDDRDIIVSSSNINLIDSAIVINYLLKFTDTSFDVLITNNFIQTELDTYEGLKKMIRTRNVINLNLRQSEALADEFSSLILSTIRVPIERFEPDYDFKSYRLSLSKLMGGHAGDNINKVRLNSIKLLVRFFRRMKAKVDLDMVSIFAGDRYDNVPNFADIDFVINNDFQNELENIYEIFKNELIEKNLRYEPDMKIDLREIDVLEENPMTSDSFNKFASFVELCPSGTFSVNSIDDQVISSSNLATTRTLDTAISLVLVFRSLSSDNMEEMVDKSKLAAKISNSDFKEKIHIPRWKNSEDILKTAFKDAYSDLYDDSFDIIKTQYSLDSSMVFNKVNVNIVSIGVKYKQDDEYFESYTSDIAKVIRLIENVLSKLKNSEEHI